MIQTGIVRKILVHQNDCIDNPRISALLAVSAKLSKPTGQKISKVRKQQKKFNSADLVLMSIGKSGIITKQLRFYSVRPNVHLIAYIILQTASNTAAVVLNLSMLCLVTINL
jgi:hypothetical protein